MALILSKKKNLYHNFRFGVKTNILNQCDLGSPQSKNRDTKCLFSGRFTFEGPSYLEQQSSNSISCNTGYEETLFPNRKYYMIWLTQLQINTKAIT